MCCFHYFIFFSFLNCQILQLNAFDEEDNDIFAELWQKSEKYDTKSGKSEETLQTSNDNFQKIGKIKKEIVVKDEPNDYDEFSNERQQKIALNKTVKEENVEKRVKSEFMEFDRFSDKEEFDNGKDGEEQSTDSIFDNSNLKESSSKSQKGVRKNYSEIEKQEIIAEFNELKKEIKTRTNEMSYDMKKVDEKIARTFGVSRSTINNWKKKFGVTKKRKRHTDVEKVELLKNFYKIKKENPQLRTDEIAQMLNIHITTLYLWERKSKGSLKPGVYKMYSEVEKQEIIAEFAKLQNKFKPRARGLSYDMKKVNEKIAQKLGVSYRTITNWKRQFGVSKKRKNYTDTEKVELLKNFNKIKKENPQLRTDEIAQMLNIHITTLNLWDKKYKIILEPDIKKIYSEVEKQGIIAEFDGLKNDFKTRANGMSYDMKKIDEKIAQKLGVSRRTIYYWKRQIGVSMDNGGPIDNVQRHVGFERSTSSAIL